MSKTVKFLVMLAVIFTTAPSCSKLHSGDTFIATENGVDFRYEVIVSRMNYVRVSPVAGSDMLSGEITIPARVCYDHDDFVVTQIAENAFRNYSLITSVVLPSTLTTIEGGAFQGCSSLTTINTPQPLSVIGDHAFDGCVNLEAFDLMASISTLGEACFRGCEKLSDLTFPTSFTEIHDEAFYGCVSLTELVLPSTVMKIGDDAFGACAGLTSVSMDRSVGEIGEGAFAGCTSLAELTCLTATPPRCDANTFDGINESIPVTVPMASVDYYRTATGWSHFTNYSGVY